MSPAPHRIVKDVMAAVRAEAEQGRSFVRIDVRNFFPSILHNRLDSELKRFHLDPLVRALCMNAVRTPTGAKVPSNGVGVPQGLSISGALAAIYMATFDVTQKSRHSGYYRYVDDILVICQTVEAAKVLDQVTRSLNSRGLKAHKLNVAGKTEIAPLSDGIDYLGYRLCYGKVSIRKSSYNRMYKNLLKVITDFRYRKNFKRTLFRLNLKITGCIVDEKRRGWMMFFSQTEDMSQLKRLDIFVQNQLKRVGFPEDQLPIIARFVKSCYEIRFNLEQTKYIPDFNSFTQAEKIDVIAALSDHSPAELQTWEIEAIENEFSRLISREVHDLETDVGAVS